MKATRLYYERERGVVDVPTSPVPIKGPLTTCVLPCSTLKTSSGEAVCVFGLPDSYMTSLAQQDRLFCDHHTVVCRDGLSRVFAGMAMDPSRWASMKNDMVLPEFGGPMHGANEAAPIDKLLEALKIYILALLRLEEIDF